MTFPTLNVIFSWFSAERDWYLWHVSDKNWKEFVMDDLNASPYSRQGFNTQRAGCDEIFQLLFNAIIGGTVDEILKAGMVKVLY